MIVSVKFNGHQKNKSIKQTNKLEARKIRKKMKLHHKMCDSKIHVLEGPVGLVANLKPTHKTRKKTKQNEFSSKSSNVANYFL